MIGAQTLPERVIDWAPCVPRMPWFCCDRPSVRQELCICYVVAPLPIIQHSASLMIFRKFPFSELRTVPFPIRSTGYRPASQCAMEVLEFDGWLRWHFLPFWLQPQGPCHSKPTFRLYVRHQIIIFPVLFALMVISVWRPPWGPPFQATFLGPPWRAGREGFGGVVIQLVIWPGLVLGCLCRT